MKKEKSQKVLLSGIAMVVLFILWTVAISLIDVQPIGPQNSSVGFATLNGFIHSLTGVHMAIYTITDWSGLVPIFICMFFGLVGLIQLVKRKNLLKVDFDIIILGVYYVIVILCYLIFEMYPINYRPILINGFMESSYPSSTTLLVLCVIPTLVFQANQRLKSITLKRFITIFAVAFSIFMVVGRLISGVHWLIDIIGSCLLSAGLFYTYKGIVLWNSTKNSKI